MMIHVCKLFVLHDMHHVLHIANTVCSLSTHIFMCLDSFFVMHLLNLDSFFIILSWFFIVHLLNLDSSSLESWFLLHASFESWFFISFLINFMPYMCIGQSCISITIISVFLCSGNFSLPCNTCNIKRHWQRHIGWWVGGQCCSTTSSRYWLGLQHYTYNAWVLRVLH